MPIGARDPTLAEARVNLGSCPLPNSMSTVALMQNAVDLRSVFLDNVDPEARDSQQLPCRSWRQLAMALNAWSLKMRNAGTPRRLASARRQVRSASSIRESGPSDRFASGIGFG